MLNVFTGKTGRIQLFVPSATSPESNDAKAVFKNYGKDESPPVGRVTNIEIVVDTDLEEFHEIGRRHPVVLQPGNIHIGGHIERAYLSGAIIALLLGRGTSANAIAEPYVQPSFGIIVDLSDPAYTDLTEIVFRIYSYAPAAGNSVEFVDVTVNGISHP